MRILVIYALHTPLVPLHKMKRRCSQKKSDLPATVMIVKVFELAPQGENFSDFRSQNGCFDKRKYHFQTANESQILKIFLGPNGLPRILTSIVPKCLRQKAHPGPPPTPPPYGGPS